MWSQISGLMWRSPDSPAPIVRAGALISPIFGTLAVGGQMQSYAEAVVEVLLERVVLISSGFNP
jgi:hypothetical protein